MTIPLEATSIVGPGFNSTSRLASTPASMMLSVLDMNRENILNAIKVFKVNMKFIEEALQSPDFSNLAEILNNAREKRTGIL
jgi:prephenate dehydrogenase